jgi:hypothetical protein
MHYYVRFAVVADSAEDATETLDEFMAHFPSQWDYYNIEEVVPLTGSDGRMDAEIREEIEGVMANKDAAIAENIRMFAPLSVGGEVVAALNPDDATYIDDVRVRWTEALATNGRSLTMHYHEDDGDRGMTLYWLKRTLRLMDDAFHNETGFFDTEEQTSSLHWVDRRIAREPSRQWLVRVDMHN